MPKQFNIFYDKRFRTYLLRFLNSLLGAIYPAPTTTVLPLPLFTFKTLNVFKTAYCTLSVKNIFIELWLRNIKVRFSLKIINKQEKGIS